MGVIMSVRNPLMENGIYRGLLDDQTVETITRVRGMECVESLIQFIYDFPIELIAEAIENNKGIKYLLDEKGINARTYISELRHYQTIGTAFMYFSKRSILGDGVGLGKTAETAALLNVLRNKNEMTRFLMAVENSALGQTQYELLRFTGMHIISLPSETNKFRSIMDKIDWGRVDGVVIKHSMLRSDLLSVWLARYVVNGKSTMFDTFILDESSVIKNSNTKTYEYTKNICNIMNRVHFLNATTFETCLLDIYNQIDMIDGRVLPSRYKIESRHCLMGTQSYWIKKNGKPIIQYKRVLVNYKNEAEFKESLKLFYFGRYKAQVMEETDAVYKVYEIFPTVEQQLAIARKNRYMEVLNCPSEIPELNISFTRQEVPKLDRLIDVVINECQELKILIYCFHKEAQRVIANELEGIGRHPLIINGETSDDERLSTVNRFNGVNCDVLITNVKKSLNLYAGDVCIFYSFNAVPSNIQQISGRIDRSVDDKSKTYILLVYLYTPEYELLTDLAVRRSKDAKNLSISGKTAVDSFIDAIENSASE